MRFGLVFLFAISLGACSSSDRERVGATSSAITAGRPDDTDGSVVWIVAQVGSQTGYCSGVVVSPHVVLTAGHCAKPQAKFRVFLGADYNDAAAKDIAENFVDVAEHRPHPMYDPKDNIHDVGVLVTSAPIPRPAAIVNRDALAASDRGKPIRIVGFGQTTADDKTIGRRHEATTTLALYDSTGLAMTGTPSFCLFDSGGPTFMTRDGAEVVVGVHSIVSSASCDREAWDVRVDVHADFVDGVVAEADPPVVAMPEAGVDAAPPPVPSEPAAAAPSSPTTSGCSVGGAPRAPTGALVLALATVLVLRRRATRARGRTCDASRGSPRCARLVRRA